MKVIVSGIKWLCIIIIAGGLGYIGMYYIFAPRNDKPLMQQQMLSTPDHIADPQQYPILNHYQKLNDIAKGNVDYDCGDFASQSDAQFVYQDTIDEAGYDKFKLDGNSDGEACESLP